MKILKRLRGKLIISLIIAGLIIPQTGIRTENILNGKNDKKVVTAASTTNLTTNGDDWLHAVGNKIVDENGNQVLLTGTNWFGFNTGTNCFDGIWSCNLETALSSMADHGINFLRIPISVEIVNQWANGVYPTPNVNLYTNPALTGKSSLDILDITVRDCKTYGIKIMFDIHSAKTDAMGHMYPLWYNGTITTENFYQSLEWLTNRYKNDDTVLAMDLKNEPHGKPYQDTTYAIWDDSTSANNWKYVAQTAAQRILAINPNMLIVVEGIEAYPKAGSTYASKNEADYYNSWWGGNLRGVADYPINLGANQKQLIYSPHDYGPSVYKQPWFYSGFTKDTLYNDYWKDNWAYISDQNIAPLLMGEWGGFLDGGDNEKWMTDLRDYMIENKISHTFWCFNANSGDTGGLVGYDFTTWDEAKYDFLKPSLWQTNSGKFIGLDHQIPLGKNGITVSQYYGSTPTSSDSTISTSMTTFDKNVNKQADLAVTLTLNGNTFNGIKNGTTALTAGIDYTVAGNIVTVTKEYLAKQAIGTTNLTFDFSAGNDPILAVAVTDSTLPAQQAAAPTFSVPSGMYTTAQTVALSSSTAGATIRYTTDGTTPTASSSVYSTPISVTGTTTIKAYAVKSGMTDSSVASATYTISSTPQATIIVSYTIASSWSNGANINVTIKNSGTTAINGWNLVWTLPNGQSISNMWSGAYTVSGAIITVKDQGYNGSIAASGGTQSFGFNLSYSGTLVKPTSFTLNGVTCQIQ